VVAREGRGGDAAALKGRQTRDIAPNERILVEHTREEKKKKKVHTNTCTHANTADMMAVIAFYRVPYPAQAHRRRLGGAQAHGKNPWCREAPAPLAAAAARRRRGCTGAAAHV
jgi:hypothetical protein